ncbi:hypothetical protein KUTeg_015690 [Tegillarca granosa]|uniref:Tyrosine-protein kinase catalytic domain-containing protein n=1 Tax=Tegillarca granosa TaxID=220873 RepID=A0ABQ9ENE7_TEGGR|nr:hypothetical protein KUTeg_015690 [Tegillarca granosa]
MLRGRPQIHVNPMLKELQATHAFPTFNNEDFKDFLKPKQIVPNEDSAIADFLGLSAFVLDIKNFYVAYGVLLWEIFSYALLPYPGMSNSEVMVYVHQGKRLSLPEGCPNCIFKVMENCWNLLPEFRPTFEEIVKELKYLNKEFYRNTEDGDIPKIHIDDKNICLYENEKPQ